jgi:L-malate glycosyltransferase
MRILFCCEFYAPSVGGVQEVMRQVAERLVAKGHDVTVATSRCFERTFRKLNGVRIEEFSIAGNLVTGMTGNLNAYRNFVTSGHFDVVMIKAAQQWTFDALWPVLDAVKCPKVFIPCGFSCFYEPRFREYFRRLSEILRRFDHLIFYASDYRDINFAREHGLSNFSIIPNGASEAEFAVRSSHDFRKRYGIDDDELLLLSVGNPPVQKGHVEVAEAFRLADLKHRRSTLILNAQWFQHNGHGQRSVGRTVQGLMRRLYEAVKRDMNLYHDHGLIRLVKNRCKPLFVRAGLGGMLVRMGYKVDPESGEIAEHLTPAKRLSDIAADIESRNTGKRLLMLDLPRTELVNAFVAADLFVFASRVEYSPLVLYEAVAAGTPFLSVPVGNVREIAEQTGAGIICPAEEDERGYMRVDPMVLARHLIDLTAEPVRLRTLGSVGRQRWWEKFTWQRITDQYEAILRKVCDGKESVAT